jgi:large subunit ribosomal protein L20
VAAKAQGISYSRLINGLTKAGVRIDRKMLSDIAIRDPKTFAVVADTAKVALAS